ncbi:MAG: hypothetical protein U0R19_12495 [Bryobacteraceae bacterium]
MPPLGHKAEERAATQERGAWYDTSNRETVRQAYLNTFTSVSMSWTGAVSGCTEGTTSTAWRTSAAARINWFRSMAGVPDGITLNDTYNTKDQRAALMMSAARALNHTPDLGWPCANAAGIDAAGNSNLCYSWNITPEPGCVSQYIDDQGASNYFVGHRRWILHPQTQQMGTGDVDQTGNYPTGYPYANALWVFDGHTFDPRPATRDGYVAWPPKGYVPYQKVFARWSFAYPGANFSGATVTMNGSSSGVTKETTNNDAGYGENTLVWTWTGTPSGTPASDTTITVTISGITGAPQSSYTYQVIIFDPATSGGGGTTAVTVTTNPVGRSFTVDSVNYSSPQVFNWTPGSQHTIATTQTQTVGTTRYQYSNWSDSGGISHTVTTPASATTYTANFTTQYLLTTGVSPGGSGTITPNPSSADGFYNSGTSVQLTASAAQFQNWSGDLSGSTNPQNVVMNGPRSVTANYSGGTVSITVTTNPVGRSFSVDGNTYTSAQVFNWTQGSQHTIATTSPQTVGTTRYQFSSWSDAGGISHTVTTPGSSTTYTASFTTQYQLTTSVSPGGAGTITANPSSGDGFYDSGATVQLTASATQFQNWSGDLAGSTNPQNVVMNGPRSVTANYLGTISITVTTSPTGRSFTVDGNNYTSTQVFNWTQGSQHTIATTDPQTVGTTRYRFASWSDAGGISHTVTTPGSSTTYTASFTTQYQLTTAIAPVGAGTITPNPTSADGFYNSGTSVQLTASAAQFANWSGDLTGTTNPQSVVMNAARSVTANFTSTNSITVTTSPAGRSIVVDGATYTAPQVFNWSQGSQHTIATTTPQTVGGTRFVFASWSDAGAISHTVTAPATATTYTANFTTQYLLTSSVSPNGAGTLTANPSSADGFYNAGTNVQLTASAAQFLNWSGDLTGTANPQTVAMNAARTVTANYSTGQACAFNTQQSTYNVPATFFTGSIAVTANCAFTPTPQSNWIHVQSGASETPLRYTVDRNTGTSRVGVITVGTAQVTIVQDAAPGASAALRFVSLEPCRLMETRPEYNYQGRTGTFGPPFLQPGETRTLIPSQSNVCTVPADAKAYVLNVTLVPRGGVDFITVWPAGQSQPNFWTVRSPDAQIVANAAIVAAGTGGGIQVYSSNTADLIIDIAGYFTDSTASNLVFYPLTPCRVIDTRLDYRQPAGPFGPPSMTANSKRTFQFPAGTYCNVPATARAFSVSLTAVPKGALQFMTIWPAGGPQPNVSSINSPSGRILANSVIVPASANGSIDVYAYNDTDFLIDINGYFAPDDGQNGMYFFTAPQCRVSDTTAADGPAYPNDSTRTIGIAASDRCLGIPTNAKAFAMNFTAIPGGSPMPFLTAYPTGQSQPNASVLNAFEGQIVTNSAIIPSGPNGQVNVYAYRATNVVVELSGYFGR